MCMPLRKRGCPFIVGLGCFAVSRVPWTSFVFIDNTFSLYTENTISNLTTIPGIDDVC